MSKRDAPKTLDRADKVMQRPTKPSLASEVQVSPVQPPELEELADLAARSFSDAFGQYMTPEDLKVSLQSDRSVEYFTKSITTSHILVAKKADMIVGYVQYGTVKIPEAPADSDDRELGRLYVDTSFQGQGIGSVLMDAAMADPEMTSAPKLYLQVWDQNTRALAMYKRYGFMKIGVTHFTLGDATPAEDVIMVRKRSA